MPAEARVTKMWTQQKGLIPIMFLAFGAYFLWDGVVGYPRSDERWQKHQELKDQPGEWDKYCATRGWTTKPPEQFLGPAKYREQYWWGGITGALGLLALGYWQRVRRSVVRSEDEAVLTPSGRRVPYASITRVDKRLWKSKGFAYVHYTEGQASGKFTLDDAKYDPKALETVLGDILAKTQGKAAIEE